MGDWADEVQGWNELHFQVSMHNQLLRAAPERHPDFDGSHCVECGDEVEEVRLSMGRIRCAACQQLKEQLEAARRRNGRPQ